MRFLCEALPRFSHHKPRLHIASHPITPIFTSGSHQRTLGGIRHFAKVRYTKPGAMAAPTTENGSGPAAAAHNGQPGAKQHHQQQLGKRPQQQQQGGGERRFKGGKGGKRARKRERDMTGGTTDEVLRFDLDKLRESLLDAATTSGEAASEEAEESEANLPEKGSEIEVDVVELSSTGEALALQKGSRHIYVVPFAVPGDTIRIRPWRRQGDHTVSDFVSVVAPSPLRDDARVRCGYFARCGGCQFQMLDYAEQLRLKRRVVEKAFANFSELPPELLPPVLDTMGSPLQYGYRTKLTPHFDGPPGGGRRAAKEPFSSRPDIGFMVKGQRKTMDIEDCPIGTDAVRMGMRKERARMDREFATYKKGATILLRESTERWQKGSGEIPELAKGEKEGEDVITVESPDGYVERKTCITDNNAISSEFVGPYTFKNPAGSFFQNNNSILPSFTDYVRQHVMPPTTTTAGEQQQPIKYLIDAYSGSGLFTITLAHLFRPADASSSPPTADDKTSRSTGIDISDASIQFAATNARINGLPPSHARFLAADAAQLFRDVSIQGSFGDVTAGRYDPDATVVILDPPRKGCDASFLSQLLRFGPRRVVYVSCNVHTQARDVGVLVRGLDEGMDGQAEGTKTRYEVESIRGFDFFPQTHHVEGVAVLNRVG